MPYVVKLSGSIITPLADGTAENFQAILAGKSALRHLPASFFGVQEDLCASVFAKRREGFRSAEEMVVRCVKKAVSEAGIDPAADDVQFIFSTVKGDVDGSLPDTEAEIVGCFGNPNTPVTVSNACTSGVCALIEGMRALRCGRCRFAVVIGYEFQSRFIVSGFQSFKALSPEPCRPFDAQRHGLNLGEAVAVMVLGLRNNLNEGDWVLSHGAIRNDANHISGPSRTGEGSYNCLKHILESGVCADDLAFVNVHGTATAYNDEMEAIALGRAGLQNVPLNAMKGVFGHTMGAAGILETLLSMKAVEDGLVLPTPGFETSGVSVPVNVSSSVRHTSGQSFIKLLSGFGGINAALLCTRAGKGGIVPAFCDTPVQAGIVCPSLTDAGYATVRTVNLSSSSSTLGGLYRSLGCDYPKFFKMDPLSKLGFLAVEQLLADEPERFEPKEDIAVFLFTRNGCKADDDNYRRTIADPGNFFPSPGLFVYTLPNIVSGEIAIRNVCRGETSVYVIPTRDDSLMEGILCAALADNPARKVISGWVDCRSENDWEASLNLIEKTRL